MKEVLHFLLDYLLANWQSILTYLAGGALVSTIAELWIRFKGHDKTLWKEVTVGTVTGLTTLSDWIINNYATSPFATLGNIGPRIFVAAVVTHRILVNPVFKTLPKVVASLFGAPVFNVWRDAKAYRLQQQTPVAPSDTSSSLL